MFSSNYLPRRSFDQFLPFLFTHTMIETPGEQLLRDIYMMWMHLHMESYIYTQEAIIIQCPVRCPAVTTVCTPASLALG
jgi:hypothetical protein